MAIEETRKKITFVPFEIKKGREVDTSPAPTITIKNGNMRFSKKYIDEVSLNGQFIKLFYDPIKNVVGWQVKKTVSLESVGKVWKMVRQNAKTGLWTISIGKMLALIDPKYPKMEWHKLPVTKYIEANGMDRGQIYFFVDLHTEVKYDKSKADAERAAAMSEPLSDENALDMALAEATK